MSKLNFASLNDAFILGSQQIKDTQEEISKLKSLVLETSGFGTSATQQPKRESPPPGPPGYSRVGPPDTTQATFSNNNGNDLDTLIDKLIQSPRFSDIVSQYISSKYPGLTLSATSYQPAGSQPAGSQQPAPPQQPVVSSGFQTTGSQQVMGAKESFGATASCDTTKNMILFILMAFVMYMFFSLFFEN